MGSTVIYAFLAVCGLLLLVAVFRKRLGALVKMLISGICGGFGIALANYLLAPVGLVVGINAISLITVALLGIPGFVTLYLMGFLL